MGIQQYDEKGDLDRSRGDRPPLDFNKLDYSEKDAREFSLAVQRIGFETRLLVGIEARKTRILDTLAAICKDRQLAGRTLIVYMAGHGVAAGVGDRADSCFCPYDVFRLEEERDSTESTETFGNLINIDKEVVTLMAGSAAGRKCLFVDACRNLGRPVDPGFKISRNLDVQPTGVDIMFSCNNGQYSREA